MAWDSSVLSIGLERGSAVNKWAESTGNEWVWSTAMVPSVLSSSPGEDRGVANSSSEEQDIFKFHYLLIEGAYPHHHLPFPWRYL